MRIRTPSIQSRLILLVLAALLAVEAVTAWTGYQRAVHEADELLDAQLVQYAQIMLSLGRDGSDDEVRLPDIQAHHYQGKLMFQIWDMQGSPRLMFRSPEAPHEWPPGVQATGYSEATLAGHAWRFFVARGDEGHVVLAAHDLHIREELASEIALSNMAPYLLAVPILAALLLLAIRRGLAPLHALADEVSGRDPLRLDELPEAGLPKELGPPIRAMNQLFGRIRAVLDKERRFTSDAAHELRTPIAALRAQLQLAERTPDPGERQAAIAKALQGTTRMAHLVGQLLALARLDSEAAERPDAAVDLGELLEEVVRASEAQAAQRKVTLQRAGEPACAVTGNVELLRVLLRNLVDNALRYTPEGGHVRLTLARSSGRVLLMVEDSGPGVPHELRDRLGLRFHRLGPRTVDGVGLGLSIVQRIAELHGATLAYADGLDGRGLGVTVSFPAAA